MRNTNSYEFKRRIVIIYLNRKLSVKYKRVFVCRICILNKSIDYFEFVPFQIQRILVEIDSYDFDVYRIRCRCASVSWIRIRRLREESWNH